jgi:GNAT superfamily N-acetyltransferase
MLVANQLAPVVLMRCLALTVQSRVPRAPPIGCRLGVLSADALRRAAREGAQAEMDDAFIDEALARGDRCYGALLGDAVASFAWYATRPTPIDDERCVHFGDDLVYMYKAFTLPEHRGQGLHAASVTHALAAYAREGYRGLVCYIESTNFSSVRAHHRIGFRDFGQILCLKVGTRFLVVESDGCSSYGFRIETRARS